jgi:hypothetical protein
MVKLTNKQKVWVEAYLQCFNATEAARIAGYKSPRIMGPENLAKPALRARIDERLNEMAMGANEVIVRLTQQAKGLPPECFDTNWGGIFVDFEKVKELGLTHLIKEVSYNAKGQAQVKFYDGQAALIKLGQYYALFTDKLKVESDEWRKEAIEYIRSGEIDYKALADEFGINLATELFKQAGVRIGTEGES